MNELILSAYLFPPNTFQQFSVAAYTNAILKEWYLGSSFKIGFVFFFFKSGVINEHFKPVGEITHNPTYQKEPLRTSRYISF